MSKGWIATLVVGPVLVILIAAGLIVRLANKTDTPISDAPIPVSTMPADLRVPPTEPAVIPKPINNSPSSPVLADTAPDDGKTVHVEGYYRKDGTYVHPYNRAPPGSGRSRK